MEVALHTGKSALFGVEFDHGVLPIFSADCDEIEELSRVILTNCLECNWLLELTMCLG